MKILLTSCFLFLGLGVFAAGPWFQKSDLPADARHRSTAFSIGNNGYLGLGHINSGVDVEYEDFWKYDPASNSWTQIANYPEGKIYHAACFVIGNLGYVGTGRYENGSYSTKFHAYNPQTNTWSQIADFIGPARRGAVGFTLNNKGYVGTGQMNSGYSAAFYEYSPLSDSWAQVSSIPGSTRTSSVAFTIGNYGYVGTGNTFGGSENDFYQYDATTDTWTQKANVGNITRQEAHGFSLDGFGYIGTGDDFSSGNNFKDFWKYDPASDAWVQLQDFDGTARRYLTGFTIGSRAYMGTGTNGTNFNDFWMYDPALTGLEEFFKETRFNVFPNPASDLLNFDLKGIPLETGKGEQLKLHVRDLQGKSIVEHEVKGLNLSIDVSNLTKSLYVYTFEYGGVEIKSGKLILGN